MAEPHVASCAGCGRKFKYTPNRDGAPKACAAPACQAAIVWDDDRWAGHLRTTHARQAAGIPLQPLDVAALDRIGEPVPRCGEMEAECLCGEVAGHDGAHGCRCGGAWVVGPRGALTVVRPLNHPVS